MVELREELFRVAAELETWELFRRNTENVLAPVEHGDLNPLATVHVLEPKNGTV